VFFWFEGKKLAAREGDSIAKALFHNEIKILSHSVKYGRPRGIHCGRGRCVMCHVEVDGVSGVKSCITPLSAGMRVRRQNYNPFYGSLMNRVMRRIPFPAGFYYRMFTRPRWVREAFIGTIRRLAGVGRIEHRSPEPHDVAPPDSFLAGLKPHYGVAVVGAGVSGMAAALAAAQAGAEVLLVDEYASPGGHSMGRRVDTELAVARDGLVRSIEVAGSVTLAPLTTALAFYAPDRLLLGREAKGDAGTGMRSVTAGAFVFAGGALDTIPLFENNDTPGVFGSRGLRLFLERDGLVPGKCAVVYGTGFDLDEAVGLLRAWGIEVEAAVDAAHNKLVRAEGGDWIARAVFETDAGSRFTRPCDMLCVAVGGQPAFELAQQACFRFAFEDPGDPLRDDLKVMKPESDILDDGEGPCRFLVGESAGKRDWRIKVEHATRAGTAAAGNGDAP
jgi:sarcosine oxidase subunit alpha